MSTVAQTISDERLTSEEIQKARTFLEQARNGILGATLGLSEAQWRFKPAADRWSIAEILEHVAMVQDRVTGPMWEQLAGAPAANQNAAAIEAIVIHQFPTRLEKFQAPDFVLPTGDVAPAESLERFGKSCARIGELLEEHPDMRRHALPSPPLKAITQGVYDMADGYQWLLTALAHTERHTKQILEVKADPDFPMG